MTTVPCTAPGCNRGTVTYKTGTARWEVITTRCSVCQGTGQVIQPEPKEGA